MLQLCLLLLTLWPQEQEKPLPELKSFIAEFRKTLHSDRTLLKQYTFNEKVTEITLDGKGNAKHSEETVYHVIPGAEEWQTYRKKISKDGKPLSQKELDKQDRDQQEHVDKENRKHTEKQQNKDDVEEEKAISEIFDMYDVQLIKREVIDDHATILVTFKAKPSYKPRTDDGKILQHIAGRAWISEDDHELAKVEAEIVDQISIGAGFLAKLQKGSTLTFERRKVNNEVWLPVRSDVVLNGKLLLLKGINLHAISEYSEHKKYTVDTLLKFSPRP